MSSRSTCLAMEESYKGLLTNERYIPVWRINCLFFFIKASHVTLWPWVPVILYNAGFLIHQIGWAIFVFTLLSLIGTKCSLILIDKSQSGAVRRLFLFVVTILFVIFGVILLCMASTNASYFCNNSNYTVNPAATKTKHSLIVKSNGHPSNETSIKIKEKFKTKEKPAKIHHGDGKEHLQDESHPHSKTISKFKTKLLLENNEDNDKDELKTKINYKVHKSNHHPTFSENEKGHEEESKSNFVSDSIPYQTDEELTNFNPIASEHYEYLPKIWRSNPNEHLSQVSQQYYKYSSPNQLHPNREDYVNPYYSQSIDPEIKSSLQGSDQENIDKFKIPKLPSGHPIANYYYHKRSVDDETVSFETGNPSGHTPLIVAASSSPALKWAMIFILCILIFISGGFDITVIRLWTCYLYGSPNNSGTLNGIEAVIMRKLRLPFIGEQNWWSLITAAVWISIPTIILSLLCHLSVISLSPFKLLTGFFCVACLFQFLMITIIPLPYGILSAQQNSQPLSLYLDDEVIEEGLRRIAFHTWSFMSGLITVIPLVFTVILVQEHSVFGIKIWIAQTAAVVAILFGEAMPFISEKWLSKNLNTQVIMLISGLLVIVQTLLAWQLSIWWTAASVFLVGYAKSMVWLSIRNNAQMLGTPIDQSKEAWISWICFYIGTAFGSLIFTSFSNTQWAQYSLVNVLPVIAIVAAIITFLVFVTALFYRLRGKNRRRIYHTLDMSSLNETDSESSEDEEEEKLRAIEYKKETVQPIMLL